jgi:hypothetical protein
LVLPQVRREAAGVEDEGRVEGESEGMVGGHGRRELGGRRAEGLR